MVIFFLAFLFGLGVGSFLNVVVLRGASGESIKGRSRCEFCKTALSWRELIPIASFLIQKGRCFHCGTTLSLQYPLVEFGTGITYGVLAWLLFPTSGFSAAYAFYLLVAFVASAAAIVIFVTDLYFRIIPTWPVVIIALIGVVATLVRSGLGREDAILFHDLISSFLFSLVFVSLWFISGGRWMGFGDAKLILATSLIIGFPANISAFLFAFWLGAAGGVILMALGRKTLGDQLPFGPYILIGTALAYFFSEKFLMFTGISWFLN